MDGILSHGNRYLVMVVFRPSHGQLPISGINCSIDISPHPWISTYDGRYILPSETYTAVLNIKETLEIIRKRLILQMLPLK